MTADYETIGTPSGCRSNCKPVPKPADAIAGAGRQLLLRDARKLLNAEAFTAAQGHPWLVHATLHLPLAEGFSVATWADFQTDLLDKLSRWMGRRGLIPTYAWVRESGPVKGPHLHLLLPVPKPMWSALKLYLLRIGGFTPYGAGGEAVRLSGGAFGTYTPRMRAGLACYVLKSLSPADCTALGIRHEATEPVPLKRCGVSTNIATQARQAAGWVELRSIPEMYTRLHPAAANDNRVEVANASAA